MYRPTSLSAHTLVKVATVGALVIPVIPGWRSGQCGTLRVANPRMKGFVLDFGEVLLGKL